MKKQQLIFSFTGILILIVIVIFVNLISGYIFLRFDFSRGNIYSISNASKKILKKYLKDKLLVKAYFSKQLPIEYANNRKYLEDLLSEYKTYSGGKIKIEFIDPLEAKDRTSEANSLGIPPLKFTMIERDKYEVKEGYMGLAFLYGDKTEIIPVVKEVEGLEYDITSRIKKLVAKNLKTIGFITGHRELDLPPEINEQLYRNYNSKKIETKDAFIEDDVSCVVILGPKEKYNDKDLFIIEQFLMQGKTVGFFINLFDVDLNRFFARKLDTGFDKFLEYYGVRLLPGFIVDAQCQRIAVQQQSGFFSIQNILNYPLIPLVTDLNKECPILRNVESVGLPFVSPIEISNKNQDLTITVITKSSPKSWYKENLFYVSPYSNFSPTKEDKKGPFNLIATIEQKPRCIIKSYFTDKMTDELKKLCDKENNKINEQKYPLSETKNLGRMIVCGTAEFAMRDPALLMNIIDWLSQDEDLIAIRVKGVRFYPLAVLPYGIRLLIKYGNIFVVPGLVIILGFLLWRRRVSVKKHLTEIYSHE